MARGKKAKLANAQEPARQSAPLVTTASAVRDDPILGYKLRVFIYDLYNVSKDPSSERRLNNTTNEYYLSLPYFSYEESEAVKTAVVDTEPSLYHIPGPTSSDGDDPPQLSSKSVEDALGVLLSGYLEKRRASGDYRPCGPHHLAPLYAALYGIDLSELQDAKFLGRLRRNGL